MALENKYHLIEKGIIKEIYNYEALDTSGIYEYFDDAFANLFDGFAKIFKLKDCCFYIKNHNHSNAFASKFEKYNIIGIHSAYPILIHNTFNEDFSELFLKVALKNNMQISDAYAELYDENQFMFSMFMKECSVQFTFGHEFQHILQLNSLKTEKNVTYGENLDSTSFNLRKHVWEFDADRMATFHVLKFIFNEYLKLTNLNKNRNDDKLKCMLYIGLSSIFITKTIFYFGLMIDIEYKLSDMRPKLKIKKQDFYTKKYSHPHPLIRMTYILDYFYDSIQDTFPYLKLEQQELLNNTMIITHLYFKQNYPDENIIENYFEDWGMYHEEISNYNEELYENAIKDKAIVTLLEKRGIRFAGS